MIQRMTHVSVFVLNQESAKNFYVDKLGFKLKNDVAMGDGAWRWVTVSPPGQPDLEIVLMPYDKGPGMDKDAAAAIRLLLEKGVLGGGVFGTDDCKKTYQELRAKGVEFSWEPKEEFYGIETWMKDNSGNGFSICQARNHR